MAGLVHEDPLAFQTGLEPVQHQVQRLSQVVDLVLRARKGKPLAASLQGDLLRPAPHRLHRGQGPPGEEVAEPGRNHDRERRPDQKGTREVGEGLVAIVGGAADDDDEGAALRARRTAQDPHLALDARNLAVDELGLAGRPLDLLPVKRRASPGRQRGGRDRSAGGQDLGEALLVLRPRDGPASEPLPALASFDDEGREVVGSGTQPVVEVAVEVVLNAQVDEPSGQGQDQEEGRGESRREPCRIDSRATITRPAAPCTRPRARSRCYRRRRADPPSRAGSTRTRPPRWIAPRRRRPRPARAVAHGSGSRPGGA